MAEPEDTPVTTPLLSTVASEGREEVHTPPEAVSESTIVSRVQTEATPVIAGTTGNGLTRTLTLADAEHPVAGVVTVTVYRPVADALIVLVVADPPAAFH